MDPMGTTLPSWEWEDIDRRLCDSVATPMRSVTCGMPVISTDLGIWTFLEGVEGRLSAMTFAKAWLPTPRLDPFPLLDTSPRMKKGEPFAETSIVPQAIGLQ